MQFQLVWKSEERWKACWRSDLVGHAAMSVVWWFDVLILRVGMNELEDRDCLDGSRIEIRIV